MPCQSGASSKSPETRSRMVMAKAASLGAPPMSMVMAVGEP